MSFYVVAMLFNLLSTVSAIVCATRSYRRYGSTGRAVLAGIGGADDSAVAGRSGDRRGHSPCHPTALGGDTSEIGKSAG